MKTEINLGSCYGYLQVKSQNGKFYWCIEEYDGYPWCEIPKELYDCIIKNKDKVGDNIMWKDKAWVPA